MRNGSGRPQIRQGRLAELDGILEELAQKIDARLASSHQHDVVLLSPSSPGVSCGNCSSHQFMTRSLLEKKRCPPISMRLPLYRTVREMPPM